MTNLEIITASMALNKINEPVNTYAGWQAVGFQVKKGSKALFSTKIWKPVKRKAKAKDDEKVVGTYTDLILVNASFFGLSQVDNMKDIASGQN